MSLLNIQNFIQTHTHKLVKFHGISITVPSWSNFIWMNKTGTVYVSECKPFETEAIQKTSGIENLSKIAKYRVTPKFVQDYIDNPYGNQTLMEINESNTIMEFSSLSMEEDFRKRCERLLIPGYSEGFLSPIRFLSANLLAPKSHRFIALDASGFFHSFLEVPILSEDSREWLATSDNECIGRLTCSQSLIDKLWRNSLTLVNH